ncbi:MAG: peptidase [Bryobacterales bacterium]|nr:peptidase [Bryobacterales bacterium]
MRRIVLLLTLCFSAFSAEKRPITETDLYAFKWIADPRISPGGSEVAYTLVTVTPKHENYATSLWIVPSAGGAPRQITNGTHDSSARWSPDGSRLAFLRVNENNGKPEPAQIYVLDMHGGEARALTDLPKGAANPVWSPDGQSIAFLSSTEPADFDKKKDDEKSDVRVINRAVYRSNGTGYVDYERKSHIYTVVVPAVLNAPVKAKQITTDKFDENSIKWAKDGSQLYFVTEREAETYYEQPHSDIYAVGASGGEMHKLVSMDGPIRGMSLSPDGKRMAFLSSENRKPVRMHGPPDLYVTDLHAGSKPQNLTSDYDYEIGGGIGGDQAPPRAASPSLPCWSRDGRFVYVTSAEKARNNLKRIDARSGKLEAVTTGDWDVEAYSATPDLSKTALLISTPTNIGDLYLLEGKSPNPVRITKVNDELFSQLDLPAPEEIWYKSFDGKMIEALVQKPPQFDPAKKYPLILNIHGGPNSTYGFNFFHEMQFMAAKGYVVLYPNPRGSTSFGEEFANVIQYKYPGDDFKDLMAGVDFLIAKGYVDAGHLGVTGGSGGGVLTNWAVGHTDRFKAAVSMRSIADWSGWWYTADFTQFQPSWFKGAPWEAEADYKERSPITYIRNVQTPLMLVEGEADYRTPPTAGGEQMFRALKYLKKTVVMVRFPGESHELSRSGQPKHRVERLDHIVGWFDIYLQGKPNKVYEVSE